MEYDCHIFSKYLVFQMKNLVFQSKYLDRNTRYFESKISKYQVCNTLNLKYQVFRAKYLLFPNRCGIPGFQWILCMSSSMSFMYYIDMFTISSNCSYNFCSCYPDISSNCMRGYTLLQFVTYFLQFELYRIRLSHLLEILGISNEIPGISIKSLLFRSKHQVFRIRNFKILGFHTLNLKYKVFRAKHLASQEGMKSRVFSGFYVCPLASTSVIPIHTQIIK